MFHRGDVGAYGMDFIGLILISTETVLCFRLLFYLLIDYFLFVLTRALLFYYFYIDVDFFFL